MTRALAHRGPDGEGVEVLGPAALGHRRLSIIDLSPAGKQPLSNEDGTVWVTFNGEIYNFREIRAFLEQKGHTFRSRTDTECLVHLYEEEGEDLVLRLRGMFAFAIWDTKRRRLVLARDRAGEKPLHYRDDPDAFRFASEPLALHEDPSLGDVAPDDAAIKLYLHYGYVPSPYSAWQGARKLPPAHLLVWESGKARVRRYWQPRLTPKHDASTPAARAKLEEECRALVSEATKLRMISDVPLGAFLSGGIDSSAVVAAMVQAKQGPVRTFTIGYDDKGYDERVYARALAQAYSTQHTERLVTPSAVDVLPVLVRRYGEPFADSSAIPTYYVAQVARESVTVALAGDGGDELFGGYTRYRANELFALYGRVPEAARSLLARMLWCLPPRTKPGDVLGLAQRFVRHFEKGRGPSGQGERNGESGFVLKRGTVASLLTPELDRAAHVDPLEPYLEKYPRGRRLGRGRPRALRRFTSVYAGRHIDEGRHSDHGPRPRGPRPAPRPRAHGVGLPLALLGEGPAEKDQGPPQARAQAPAPAPPPRAGQARLRRPDRRLVPGAPRAAPRGRPPRSRRPDARAPRPPRGRAARARARLGEGRLEGRSVGDLVPRALVARRARGASRAASGRRAFLSARSPFRGRSARGRSPASRASAHGSIVIASMSSEAPAAFDSWFGEIVTSRSTLGVSPVG